ncbi:MAG: peroxidase family protein [Hyphomicrobiaceae bacterium]|nr:peroxidase family protein [Hyphomicrobiaceae bacterium]
MPMVGRGRAAVKRLGWLTTSLLLLGVVFVGVAWHAGYDYVSCGKRVLSGIRKVATERDERFLGKVEEDTLRCRGDERAVAYRETPWVDWTNYWATGDATSRSREWLGIVGLLQHHLKNGIGELGALVDLEYQRMELVRFNLFDNSTYRAYVEGRDGVAGPALRRWPEMRLDPADPGFVHLLIDRDGNQRCAGPAIRHRTVNGICNDIDNPAMGAQGQLFARNVEFHETFPDRGLSDTTRDRHGGRIGLLTPDPQVVSRRLMTRQGPVGPADTCNDGQGLPGNDPKADCPYKAAPFFNAMAAFWIQFMTHDWFSHLDEARNTPEMMETGCRSQKVANVEVPLGADGAPRLGCRPDDRIERAHVAATDAPETFGHRGRAHLGRAHQTTRNFNTAWWDASQIYGYDPRSARRLQRAGARVRMVQVPSLKSEGDGQGYLPVLDPCGGLDAAQCLLRPEWSGQEAAAFPDNWSIGLSFLHTVFAREHNLFVDAFLAEAKRNPAADSGLRNPERPDEPIPYAKVTQDELFEVARLVVSALIAKIHTTEWTPQLLYGRPLDVAMDSNWNGVFGGSPLVKRALASVVERLNASDREAARTTLYSVFSSGPGIIGTGSFKHGWSIANLDDVNGGVNHFGSPFNFPEEFVAVYRLHALVPDLLEVRRHASDPNRVAAKVPVASTRHAKATAAMRERGLADWGLSLGRQRLGLLALENSPRFLQRLELPGRLDGTATRKIDIVALDILRDRERGIPRFNEFRRQYGLKSLTGFDDFIERRLTDKKAAGTLGEEEARQLASQERLARTLREVYGTHVCDDSRVITGAQKWQVKGRWQPITDCLGRRHGEVVDNIEDLDLYVGWHAETTRPHGFAISETQFQVFILNASRRLYSDRFFTSSFREEFYSKLGLKWVNENGPDGKMMEAGKPNGSERQMSPLKRVLMRTIPELRPELEKVVNAFDPWARDRGEYYSIEWKPRADATSDESFVRGR